MRRASTFVALLIAATATAGCGEDEPFAQRDPEGYEACSIWAEAQASTGTAAKIGGLLEVGKQARRAATKAIRDSAKPLFNEEALEASGQDDDFPIVDGDALEKACSDEGFEF